MSTLAGSMLAVAAMLVGALWFVGTSVLHDQLLDRRVYLRALDESGAYRRLYTDVLTDRAVRDVTDRLLDGLVGLGVDRQDASAVLSAALRLTLPPEILREGADVLVSGIVAYLRGEQSSLAAPIPVLATVGRVDPAAASLVRSVVSMMSALLLDHLHDVESFVRTVADGLAEGEIPELVPLVGGRLVAEKQLATAIDGLTATVLPADVRDKVLAAIGSRSERDALIATALDALRSSLHSLSAELASGGDVDVDLVDALVVVSGQDREAVAAHARSVRQLVAWAPSASRYAGLALLIAGGAALARLHRRRPRRAPIVVGLGLVSAGAGVWVGWVMLSRAVGSPLRDAMAASGRGAVPDGAERLLGDIDRAVLTDLAHAWARPATTLVVLGAATVAASAATLLWARLTSSGRRRLVGGILTSVVATMAMNVTVQRGQVKAERRCNGHAELCDRRYDQIVQVATHNSMSSPDVVRVWPEHDGDIRQQLEFGVRTLMIDATYWHGVDDAPLRSLRQFVGSGATEGVIAAIESRLAPRPGIYLCHNQCALGAIPMTTALAEVKGFLDDHPDEVVTLMIQDSVAPADVAAAFAASGLDKMLYDGNPGQRWPTLGQLIDRGQRLVVFSEQHAPPPAWYHSAFQHIQDTPYGAHTPAELSCAPNRGPRDAPLFLMNHWIEREAPDRAVAAVVNAKEFIVERARRCARERGKLPNFVAVSFYGIGDVIGAVDELNGVAPAA